MVFFFFFFVKNHFQAMVNIYPNDVQQWSFKELFDQIDIFFVFPSSSRFHHRPSIHRLSFSFHPLPPK